VKQKVGRVTAALGTALFRSAGQAAVLRTLRYAGSGLSITEIAARTGLALSQVHAEIERLEEAGVVRSRRVGRTRLVELDPTSPVASEVAALVDKLLGAEPIIGEALSEIPGVQEAHIFGSWAARRRGVPGDDPADVDVLVIGDADPDDVLDALRPVEATLGRPVNVVVRSRDEWERDDSGFARSVRAHPMLTVVAGADG
jgi:DNA-binding transcriptional ArsR family regulator